MAIGLAFKAFFQVLFRKEAAQRVAAALADAPAEKPALAAPAKPAPAPAQSAKPSLPTRSDALTLLSTLQREARFLDLVGESLDQFNDAQVGAAARQVIADVRKTLQRMFNIQPLSENDEGTTIPIHRPISPVACESLVAVPNKRLKARSSIAVGKLNNARHLPGTVPPKMPWSFHR